MLTVPRCRIAVGTTETVREREMVKTCSTTCGANQSPRRRRRLGKLGRDNSIIQMCQCPARDREINSTLPPAVFYANLNEFVCGRFVNIHLLHDTAELVNGETRRISASSLRLHNTTTTNTDPRAERFISRAAQTSEMSTLSSVCINVYIACKCSACKCMSSVVGCPRYASRDHANKMRSMESVGCYAYGLYACDRNQ